MPFADDKIYVCSFWIKGDGTPKSLGIEAYASGGVYPDDVYESGLYIQVKKGINSLNICKGHA